MRRKRAAVIALLLLVGLIARTGFWLRAERRQYALNRALIDALAKGDDKQALVLVNAGADPNTRYERTPIPSLAELVKQLFHRSPPATNGSLAAFSIACGGLWNDEESTMLAQEARPDAAQLVETLLQHGATVNAPDKDDWTPLMWAVRGNRCKTVGVLLEHRAKVNAKTEAGLTPLMEATMASSASTIVRLLLQHRAEVNAQDWERKTALCWAVSRRDANKDVVCQLIMHGADPNLADKNGETPRMLAQDFGRPDIAALLHPRSGRK